MKYKILEFKNLKETKIYRVKKRLLGIFWRYIRESYTIDFIPAVREWDTKEDVCEWVQHQYDYAAKDKRLFIGEVTCE